MNKRLSSSSVTFGLKIVLPSVWIVFFGGLLLESILAGTSREGMVAVVAIWLIGTALIYSFGVRLKSVALTDKSLRISNYVFRETVPLEHVREITEIRFISWYAVKVEFSRPTRFGEEIYYFPIPYVLEQSAPVEELKEMVRLRRQGFDSGSFED